MTAEDIASHESDVVTPISVRYRGVDVWEIPPNGQGITALIALNILEGFDLNGEGKEHNSADYLHLLIEAMRLAFADSRKFVGDMDAAAASGSPLPIAELLSSEYAESRRKLIDPMKATVDCKAGSPLVFNWRRIS